MTETMSTPSNGSATKFPTTIPPQPDATAEVAPAGSQYIPPQIALISAAEQHEIEQFYYYEAALLDAHKFTAWVDLFTDDCRYFMPVRQTRLTGQLDEEFSNKPGDMAFFDDDKELLTFRAKKLESQYAWGENPPSRTRHLFTNIRVVDKDDDTIQAHSNFVFFRGSYERHTDWWVGRREDILRRENGGLRIAGRQILLDHTVILSQNMSHFF